MCNAWNHSSDCNCGFPGGSSGGGSSRGGSRAGTALDNIPIRDRVLAKKIAEEIKGAETYPTSCWWCGEEVIYHTNGFGDSVLFDSLGSPWRKHPCWENYWDEEKLKRKETKHSNAVKNTLILHTINGKQRKRLILAGAIQSINKERNSYFAREEEVASYLGFSLEQLRAGYSHLYYCSGSLHDSPLIQMKLGVIDG
jgi:hypothetical protein